MIIMNGFQKILVPVDFSSHSLEAIRVAAELAKRFDASLTLSHVYDPLVYARPDGFLMVPQLDVGRVCDALRAELDGARLRALQAGAPQVETKLLDGVVASEIVEFAKRDEFDLIVMGTHGRTGMAHLVIGSIAERVVRLSPCPVLTVKKPESKAAGSPAPE
jgi:universal stress protein A